MKAPGLRLDTGGAPASEPVTLTEAKAWLRVDVTDDDQLITDLVKDAREYVENHTGMALITQSWLLTLDTFPPLDMSYMLVRQPRAWLPQTRQFQGSGGGVIRLPKPPLQAVNSVKYLATDGTLTTLDPSGYQVDTTTFPGRLAPAYGQVWPVTRFNPAAVTVGFTCGFGSTTDTVPGIFKRAIRLLICNWYENRGDGQTKTYDVENAVNDLLAQGWYGEHVG
jgi:uncharacterized phiE125 gp8 family phage protein